MSLLQSGVSGVVEQECLWSGEEVRLIGLAMFG